MDKDRRFENDEGKRWKLGISVFSPVSQNPKQKAAVHLKSKNRDIRTDLFNVRLFTLK